MSKYLVLVESPSKAKTINKYLGKNYHVEATVGHLKNLPKSKLGIDIENDFAPQFTNIRGKGDVIKKIKSLATKSDEIFIATDPDREGEAIAQDIAEIINGNGDNKILRVLFNEITEKAVKKAIDNPLVINKELVSSQRARRVMDRIIGYKISPFLWNAIIEAGNNSLSAGRVQSVALRLICEREILIKNFIATEYWSIWGVFENEKNDQIKMKLTEVEGKPIKLQPKPRMTQDEINEFLKKNYIINNEKSAEEIVIAIKNKEKFIISDVSKKEVKKNPQAPFITSSLQADASRKLRFRPRFTMKIAQSLYEGIDLGKEGIVGLITYMRTDSYRLSDEITSDARNFIQNSFGEKYLPAKVRNYEKKDKTNVQDAHEAIRPTSLKYTPEFVKPYLDNNQFKLYELIWKRFLACQMESALMETTTISVSADEYLFKASGTVLKFDGFLLLYEDFFDENNSNGEDGEGGLFPAGLDKGKELSLKELLKNQHFTKPPARFSESTLIKELESNGIGRPSTYALIVGTIQDRNYVIQEERKLIPTELGFKVNDTLTKNFPDLFNVNFTSQMESELDSIAKGDIEYVKVLNDFYEPFINSLRKVEDKIEKIKCDKCGSDMEIKFGRFGRFLACSNYPECKNIKSLKEFQKESNEPQFTGDICPKCGARTIYRYSKFGKFIGCEKYPDCDFTKQITLGIPCPKCNEGEVIAKKSKKGKTFYGCSRYPDCDFVSWTRPQDPEKQKKLEEGFDYIEKDSYDEV